jgi:hypothetical protein
MNYDSAYIHSILVDEGCSLADYSIVDGLIMNLSTLDDKIVPMAFVIEDEALNEACIDYLKEKGAKQFDSMEEVQKWIERKTKRR